MPASDVQQITFIVEEAGCSTCATRIRSALQSFAPVDEIRIDEEADAATVVLRAHADSQDLVERALIDASAGAGHSYRIRPGSWTTIDQQ